MDEFLFNAPWWAPIVVAAIGLVVFITGNTRQETRVRTAGLVIGLLGIAYGVISFYVDTSVEKAEKGTRGFVQAVVDRDPQTLQKLLDPMASLTVLNSATPYSNGESIKNAALSAKDQFGISAAHVTSLTSTRSGAATLVTVDVLSEQEKTYGRPVPTSWQFEWTNTKDGPQITRITCLRIANSEGDAALSQFPPGISLPKLP